MSLIDVSAILGQTKIALEKNAQDQFGAVVEDYTRGVLNLPAATGSSAFKIGSTESKTWNASSYAAAMAGSSFRPKLKFLFKVQFFWNAEIVALYPGIENQDFTFMIKSVDRPKVDFEYEDDVNIYNYRTKALKKIKHRELTITFTDDVGNKVFDFFRTLMEIYSPVTKGGRERDQFPFERQTNQDITLRSNGGMNFKAGTLGGGDGHRSVVNTGAGQAIDYIRVKQMYMDPSTATGGPKEVIFDFFNPRLVSFDLDDLTHESSDANLLTMQFDYDWLEMVKVSAAQLRVAQASKSDGPYYSVQGANITGAPVNALGVDKNTTSETFPFSNSSLGSAGGGLGGFGSILTDAASRAVNKITSDAISRAVTTVAGNGAFAQTINTVLVGASGSSGGGVLGGLTGNALRDPVSAMFSTVQQNYARARSPVASDSALGGIPGTGVAVSVQSSPFYDPVNPVRGGA
jgi:hypothetical protein